MKSWIVFLLVFLYVFSVFSFSFVAAQENDSDNNESDNDNSGSGSDNNETDDDSDDDSDNNETDDDTDDDSDSEDETDSEDEEDEEDEDEEEAEVTRDNLGAKVRMLQLKRAITRRVLWGQNVVEYMNDNNVTGNVTELQGIVDDLKVLADEAGELAKSDVAGDRAVEKYLEIKRSAKELVKQFREIAKDALKESDKSALRRRFGEIERDMLKEINDEIREIIREHNVQKVREHLREMGIEREEIIKKIESGELNASEIRLRLREELRDLSERKREEFRVRVREERIEIKNRIDEVSDGVKIRTREEIKTRIG